MPVETGSAIPQGVAKPAPVKSALPPNPLNLHGGLAANPLASHLATRSPYVFHATPGELAPGDPRRVAALNMIAHHISGAVDATPFTKHLQAMNVTPDEQDFINTRLKSLHSANDKAQLHDLTHTVLPKLGHTALSVAAGLSGAAGIKKPWLDAHGKPVLDKNGKPLMVQGDIIGVPFLGAGKEIAARSTEQAAQHISEAAATAKAEGFGAHIGSKGNPPQIQKGAASPETGGEVGRQIRESLPHAPAIRNVQKAGYSDERSLRVAAGSKAHLEAGGGIAGHLAAMRHQEGPLGQEFFGHLRHFTPDQVDEAARVIDKAPMQFWEQRRAVAAIRNAVEHGVAPTESEQKLLERAFGKVAGTGEDQAKLSSFWDKFVSYTNIPRALRSSADVSAALRQGLVVLVTHPSVWGRQFARSIRSFGSEDFYQAQQAAIHNDPLYPLFVKWKVPFTEIGGKVANTEEAFIGGQAAEHLHELPGIKGTPVAHLLRPASNVIRRSDRAFTGFQNGARFEMAKMLAEKASLLGLDFDREVGHLGGHGSSLSLGESIGRVVGTFTGRGVTPKVLEGHLTTMNALMFSPRLMAARLNLLSPVYFYKLDPVARAEAMRGARNLVASIGTVMFVAKMLGAEVNFDPRSSNFTKIKLGNTRIDISGGFSQYVRFVAQEMTREAISSAGHKSHIGWGQNDISDLANLTKLGRSKAAPIPGLLWDEASGKDFIGQPIKQKHELWQNAPFIAQDTYDAQRLSGSRSAVIDAFLSAIGLGVQSYKDKPPKASTGGGGSGYGGTSDYGTGGSSYGGGGTGYGG